MTRKYSLVMEHGPAGYSGYVPELPTILVTGSSENELMTRAADAIKIYLEAIGVERSPTSVLCEIEVELPV